MPARCRFYGVGHGGQPGAGARVAAVLKIPLLRLVDHLPLPSYAREGDAGADLVAAEDVTLAPGGGRALVATGAAIAIPTGYAGFVQPRSGLALKLSLIHISEPTRPY